MADSPQTTREEAVRWLDTMPAREWGVVTSSASGLIDGQPWINHNTVDALRTRGLVELEADIEYGHNVRLNDAGRRAAAGSTGGETP